MGYSPEERMQAARDGYLSGLITVGEFAQAVNESCDLFFMTTIRKKLNGTVRHAGSNILHFPNRV